MFFKNYKFSLALAVAATFAFNSAQAEDVITLTTNIPIGQKIGMIIQTDNGEATLEGVTGDFENLAMVEYVVQNPEITIKAAGKLLIFNAQDCGITDIDLTGAPNLTSCKLDNNQLNELNLSENTSLTTLYCQNNNLELLDVTAQTALKWLACSYNNLTELVLTQNVDLRELYCYNNNLEALDVSMLKRLGKLSCAENNIPELNVSNAGISLVSLFCSGNKIEKLDLSKNSWLVNLGCSDNLIKEIDLSKNTDLEVVFLQNNPLNHQVNLATLKKLEEIYLGNTGQSAVDVTNNPKLKTLSCSSNLLEELDITNNANIRFLYLQDNQFSGAAMADVIEALPEMTETRQGQIIVKDAEKSDKNICYVQDVEKARSKYWLVGQYQNNTYVNFDGDVYSALSQTAMAATSCVLDQGSLIINGAKPYAQVKAYTLDGKILFAAKTDAQGSLAMPMLTNGEYVIVNIEQCGTYKFMR